MGFFSGLGAAAVTAGAGLIGSAKAASAQRDTNAANLEIAQRQMDFQERMSNTAYRRVMNDMRGAGLNPILAYQQGGASAPFGASIPMVNPWGGAGRDFANTASSAMQAMRVPAELAKTRAEIEKVMADTTVSRSTEYLRRLQGDLTRAQIRTEDLRPEQVFAVTERLGYDIQQVKAHIAILREALSTARMQATSSEIYDDALQEFPVLRFLDAMSKALGIADQSRRVLP